MSIIFRYLGYFEYILNDKYRIGYEYWIKWTDTDIYSDKAMGTLPISIPSYEYWKIRNYRISGGYKKNC